MIAVGLDLSHGLGRGYLHIEPLGMGFHLVGQFAAADSFNEAGVVVDALGGAGLAPMPPERGSRLWSSRRAACRAVVSPMEPLPTITKS